MTGDALGAPVVVLQADGAWWRFAEPARVVVAREVGDITPALQAIERAVESESLYAAGYLAYESAAAYGLAVHSPAPDSPPLLWFGLYRERLLVDPPTASGDYAFGPWEPSLGFDRYRTGIKRIKNAIADGDTYQANFTFHLRADFAGDPWTFFAHLAAAQRANFCAYIDLGRFVVCSSSPELFFDLHGSSIKSRPMKGTAPRGLMAADDRRQIEWLRHSEKNRAENVMIVDMIRNDFGRIAHTGSVRVPDLFTIERYPTLLQMTSTVTAETDAPLSKIMAATFPCASITGAPKVRTMQILNELEPEPRGIYTGAIGFIAPGRHAQFNVAIRTAVIDRERGRAVYSVGSGVVWDSDARAEYDECLLKARVLDTRSQATTDFRLLESLRWTPEEGYFLYDHHLNRMRDSAGYFDFPFDSDAVARALARQASRLDKPSKVRLLLDRLGQFTVEAQPLPDSDRPVPLLVGVVRQPVTSTDSRLFHKTDRREIYVAARKTRPDCDDVILWNARGELTEASAANIVLEIDGHRCTPPLSAGLLPGTLRERLLAAGVVEERTLSLADLSRATRLWLINSVRGWQAATFKPLQNASSP